VTALKDTSPGGVGPAPVDRPSRGPDLIYEITQVTRIYGQRMVVNVDRVAIRSGEILALVGPSGAGKSTLLRLLNFLEAPNAGEIIYRGHRVNGRDVPLELRREVTTVFQRPILLSRSVAANVALGLKLRRQHQVRTAVKAALERVGLSQLADSPAHRLSGGEAQRVALARALAIEPVVLLLDEPTANLDPYNVRLIEDIVRQLNEAGTTVVLVTHNIFQARRLAHRVGLLLEGRLIEVAPVETFFENPQDPRTRAFVSGEMVY
jgi:tungstate transport system ATP-binding protein